jgi:hypothetical protein
MTIARLDTRKQWRSYRQPDLRHQSSLQTPNVDPRDRLLRVGVRLRWTKILIRDLGNVKRLVFGCHY